jgi:hypothetical protein
MKARERDILVPIASLPFFHIEECSLLCVCVSLSLCVCV